MSYRINSTGRKRILRENIQIRLIDQGAGRPAVFTAEIRLPSELGLEPTARVYIEPYVGSSSMRFDFGTASKISPPDICVLTDIDVGATVLFRVKVVDESKEMGQILASADGVRPESDADGDDRKPLLPLRTADLNEEIWRLTLDKDGGPELVLNNRIPEISERLLQDTLLQGAIYPEVVRQLVRAVYADALEGDEDQASWLSDWKSWFAEQLGRDIEDDETTDQEATIELSMAIAEAFAIKKRYATLIASVQST